MKNRKNNRRSHAIVEAVESRQLMSGANIYNFAGTAGNDEIIVRYTETLSGDHLSCRVNGTVWEKLNPSAAAININGLGGHDRIIWDDNRRNFTATFPVGVSGGAGDDSIILGGEGTYDPYFLRYTYMSMNGDAGVDRIVMDASMKTNLEGTRTEISADYISPYGAVGSDYFGIEQIDFKAPDDGRDLFVKSLNATTAVNVLNNNTSSTLTIGTGDLDTFKGIVNFNGVGGNDSVIINDSADTNGRTYNIESNKITFNTGGMVFLNNSDAVTLTGTQGQGTYRVNSVGANRPLTLTPGAATDLLDIGGGNYSANIKAGVTFFDDTANTGHVYINDAAATTVDTLTLSGGQFTKSGAPSTIWAFAKNITLAASNGANNITVTPSAGATMLIDGNSQATGAADKLTINAPADETVVRTGTGSSGTVLMENKKTVTFQDIEVTPTSKNLPTVSISDQSLVEGQSGQQVLNFAVTLSKPLFAPVSVVVATESTTALAGQDFVGTAATVTFAAGQTTRTFSTKVIGDRDLEADEAFYVRLSNSQNATLGKALGVGTILNDDVQVTKSVMEDIHNGEFLSPQAPLI